MISILVWYEMWSIGHGTEWRTDGHSRIYFTLANKNQLWTTRPWQTDPWRQFIVPSLVNEYRNYCNIHYRPLWSSHQRIGILIKRSSVRIPLAFFSLFRRWCKHISIKKWDFEKNKRRSLLYFPTLWGRCLAIFSVGIGTAPSIVR